MFTLKYRWCTYICVWKLVKEPYFVFHCVNNQEWWWYEDQKVFYHVLHGCKTFQGRCKLFRKWINPKSLSLIELHPWLFTQRYWNWLLRKKIQSENFASLQKFEVKNYVPGKDLFSSSLSFLSFSLGGVDVEAARTSICPMSFSLKSSRTELWKSCRLIPWRSSRGSIGRNEGSRIPFSILK